MTTLLPRILTMTFDGNSITNCRLFRWRTVHNVSPRLLPSNKEAVGFFQGHTHVEGEIGLLSYDSNLVEPSTADSPEVTMVVTAITTAGATRTLTFTKTVIESVDGGLGGEEPIFTYKFKATTYVGS